MMIVERLTNLLFSKWVRTLVGFIFLAVLIWFFGRCWASARCIRWIA